MQYEIWSGERNPTAPPQLSVERSWSDRTACFPTFQLIHYVYEDVDGILIKIEGARF